MRVEKAGTSFMFAEGNSKTSYLRGTWERRWSRQPLITCKIPLGARIGKALASNRYRKGKVYLSTKKGCYRVGAQQMPFGE